LALASLRLAPELQVLQQLHERLAVFVLVVPELVQRVQQEPVLKQLVPQQLEPQTPLVLVQLEPQNFLQNQY
jgi:hypothetical protein